MSSKTADPLVRAGAAGAAPKDHCNAKEGTHMLRKALLRLAMALSLLGLAATAAAGTTDPVGPDKVVYHINNTEAQAADALRNIGNHLEVNPQAKIVVVAHARGVDFLMNDAKDKNGNPYSIAVEQLKAKGVRFDVCQITLRNRKLTRDQFIPEATFVPSGVAEITRLQQREGYAYQRP
jgi:intracellular sulfur oxidation DsrE/DsrF family protein